MSKPLTVLLAIFLLMLPLMSMAKKLPTTVAESNNEKSSTASKKNETADSLSATTSSSLFLESLSNPEKERQAADSLGAYLDEDLDDEDDEDLVPASEIYPEWSNTRVNPYDIKMEDTNDTLNLDMSNFCFPLPKHYRVTSEFGFRRWKYHYGIDLKVYTGDSVVSMLDGMVRMAKKGKRGYGNYIVVRHNNGLETVYGHLSKIDVEENQVVKAGELIGKGGNTGRSTGPHLHFEIRYLGQPINPRDVINFDELCCHNDTLQITRGNFAYAKEINQIRTWTVKSGDTLGRIAKKTGVSVNRLCSLNKISRNKVLRIGQKIRYT